MKAFTAEIWQHNLAAQFGSTIWQHNLAAQFPRRKNKSGQQ